MFGFIGPNSAGKTTAIRIIPRVLEPDAREVCWRGQHMNDELRHRVGHIARDHGQTFSTLCAWTPRAQRRILGQLGQRANHRNEQVRPAATTQFGISRVLANGTTPGAGCVPVAVASHPHRGVAPLLWTRWR
jgi:ABC-type multidrug transport system ATPase subunit